MSSKNDSNYRMALAPASSSDEGDSSSDNDSLSVPKYSNFNDLPSSDPDDSSDDEDSSSDSDDDGEDDDASSNGPLRGGGRGDDDNELSLSERIELSRERGKTRKYKGKWEESGKDKMKRLLEEGKMEKSKDGEGEGGRKKKSKHAPTVVSSTRKAFYSRGAPSLGSSGTMDIKGGYKPSADPRFDEMAGTLDVEHFERNYQFLEEMEDKEIKRLKERQKSALKTGKKGQKLRKKLGVRMEDMEGEKVELNKLQMKRGEREKAEISRAARKSVKKKLRDNVENNGGKAFYLKKREMKKLEVEATFEELKKRGGNKAVKKALEKRRKKNKSKDRKALPASSKH